MAIPSKFGLTLDDRMLQYHLGDSHPMNNKRVYPAYELIKEVFVDHNELDIITPVEYEPSIVDLAHEQDFIDTMKQFSSYGLGQAPEYGLGMSDCPVFHGMAEMAEFVVNSTVTTAEKLYKNDFGMAFSMLGGLHHARSAQASGFCYYNDINVAIRKLKQKNHDIKVLYVDTDLHHGDGTQFDFYNDPKVLTLSLHESGQFLFPGTGFPNEIGEGEGVGSSLNLPFFPYSWDELYVNSFKRIFPSVLQSFNPDFVIWQAGVDSNKDDLLGHLNLSLNAYKAISELIRKEVEQNMDAPRLLGLGGGGYNPQSVAKSWATIVAGLSGVNLPRYASDDWVAKCRGKDLFVSPELFEEPTLEVTISENHDIAEMDGKYMEEFENYVSPYFSI